MVYRDTGNSYIPKSTIILFSHGIYIYIYIYITAVFVQTHTRVVISFNTFTAAIFESQVYDSVESESSPRDPCSRMNSPGHVRCFL